MPLSIDVRPFPHDAIDSIIDFIAAASALCCSSVHTLEAEPAELITLLDDDDLTLADFDDAEDFGVGFTTTFTGFFWMIRASVVQRPGTMPSSSEVQCIIPVQSLGE